VALKFSLSKVVVKYRASVPSRYHSLENQITVVIETLVVAYIEGLKCVALHIKHNTYSLKVDSGCF